MNLSKALAILAAGTLASGCAFAQLTMTGAGATFPYPIYSRWFDEYAKVDPTVRFNYQSIGSGGGQKQIVAQTVDFGATDGPMNDASLAKAPGKILHIPMVAGAVVLSYNLPGNPALKLDGPTVANIFLGKITKWNDPAIAGQNPGVKLPESDIIVVHRTDGSGTTYIFTDYLSKVSAEWKTEIGTNTAVRWPAGLGGKGNEGVSGQIQQTPSTETVTAALSAADVPEDFRFSITNSTGTGAYPISGVTWLLVYQKQENADKGKKLVEFLRWALTRGADLARALDYAPLPDALRDRVLKRVSEIQSGG